MALPIWQKNGGPKESEQATYFLSCRNYSAQDDSWIREIGKCVITHENWKIPLMSGQEILEKSPIP